MYICAYTHSDQQHSDVGGRVAGLRHTTHCVRLSGLRLVSGDEGGAGQSQPRSAVSKRRATHGAPRRPQLYTGNLTQDTSSDQHT